MYRLNFFSEGDLHNKYATCLNMNKVTKVGDLTSHNTLTISIAVTELVVQQANIVKQKTKNFAYSKLFY